VWLCGWYDPAALADSTAAAGDLAAAVWLVVLPRCRIAVVAVAEVGHRSTFRVEAVRVWDDFRHRALVEADDLAADKSRDQVAAVRVRAAGRLRVPVAAPDLAVVHVRVAAALPAAGRRSEISTTS
jgi:hypothetical protein